MRRAWTTKEIMYLEESWGSVSLKTLAKKLERSTEAIKQKAARMGLGRNYFNFDGITMNQLAIATNIEWHVLKLWIDKYNLPAKQKVFASEKPIWVIRYDEFWKWAEQHKNLLNFKKIEPNSIGPEPEWAKEKRKADQLANSKSWRIWTPEDDRILISMVNAHKYTYPEIAKALKRTEGAVKRRLMDLNSKARPVRLPNHTKYTDEEVALLLDMFQKGYSCETIAARLGNGKSALGVRGKLERMGFKSLDWKGGFAHEERTGS